MKQYLLAVFFILTFSILGFSQTKQITSSDFFESNSNAFRLLATRTRRIVTKTETFANGNVETSTTIINERLLPDKTRFYRTEKKGNEVESIEVILIGSTEYSRKNNGQWTVRTLDGNGSGSGSGIGGNISCLQYTEENDFLGGVSARKLRSLTISKSDKGLTYDDFINWFDQQELLLRSERLKGLLDPKVETAHSVTTYEYDPTDLKIEAPIK